MAITRHLAELILLEHKHRPIDGRVLLLGRQAVFLTPEEARALLEKVGIPLRQGSRIEPCKTAHGQRHGYISDASLFSMFTDAEVVACDVSDYEGAEIVFDLTGTVPADCIGAFDFIYNGSVLDNVFDPAACLRNASRMLRSSGSIMHYEGLANSGAAYLKFTPDWFFDYYALNGFADAQCYVGLYTDVHASPWTIFEWSAFAREGEEWKLAESLQLRSDGIVVVVAQNASGASTDRSPIQNVYRGGVHDTYIAAHERFAGSLRRDVIAGAIQPPPRRALDFWRTSGLPKPARGNRYLGDLGSPRRPEVWL